MRCKAQGFSELELTNREKQRGEAASVGEGFARATALIDRID
jgi:hypothetical protein